MWIYNTQLHLLDQKKSLLERVLSLKSNSYSFQLNNVFHVPLLAIDLISVQKFYVDNNVFLVFHPSFFVVKDIFSKKVLLQGLIDCRLYKFPQDHSNNSTINSIVSYFSSYVSFPSNNNALLWHNRLGHLTLLVINKVLSSCSLPTCFMSIC